MRVPAFPLSGAGSRGAPVSSVFDSGFLTTRTLRELARVVRNHGSAEVSAASGNAGTQSESGHEQWEVEAGPVKKSGSAGCRPGGEMAAGGRRPWVASSVGSGWRVGGQCGTRSFGRLPLQLVT